MIKEYTNVLGGQSFDTYNTVTKVVGYDFFEVNNYYNVISGLHYIYYSIAT